MALAHEINLPHVKSGCVGIASPDREVAIDMMDLSNVPQVPQTNSHTLQAWYYTLLLKMFSYRFAADDYMFYGSIIRNPLAFFTTICTVLQGTELITTSEYIFYIYFSVQIICNFLTILNMKLSYSEKAAQYKNMSQRYEGKSLRVRDLLTMKDTNVDKIRHVTKKLESMITKDDSVSMTYETRAKNELKRNKRLFKMAGIDFTGETDENTRRPSHELKKNADENNARSSQPPVPSNPSA
jgi:hypothetical protein